MARKKNVFMEMEDDLFDDIENYDDIEDENEFYSIATEDNDSYYVASEELSHSINEAIEEYRQERSYF